MKKRRIQRQEFCPVINDSRHSCLMDEFEAVLSETVQMFNLLLSEHRFVCFSVPEHDFFPFKRQKNP